MSPTPADQLNLKHRVTGAVILIGVAVALILLLLEDRRPPSPEPGEAARTEEPFVSRIQGSADVPPPLPPSSVREAPTENATSMDVAGVPKDEPEFKPVLRQDHRLPKSVPKLNTVGDDDVRETPSARVVPIEKSESRSPSSNGGWVLRVGAFSEQANADSVVGRLEKAGYAPSRATVTVNGRTITRVWVGPFVDRKEAIRSKTEIAEVLGLNGFVVRQ